MSSRPVPRSDSGCRRGAGRRPAAIPGSCAHARRALLIDCALLRVEEGLKKYLALQKDLKTTDVSKDRSFQKRFNHFYKVRRSSEWQTQYYELLQKNKNSNVIFSEVLSAIHKKTGRYEASFASKLVATIHSGQPVIDEFILRNAGLTLPYPKAKNREARMVSVHDELLMKLKEFLRNENGKYHVKQFKAKFQSAKITQIKMVDLVLWQTR